MEQDPWIVLLISPVEGKDMKQVAVKGAAEL